MSIRVLVCRAEQEPVVEEIREGLDSKQTIVGGWVEVLGIEPGIDLWCNEEGRLLGLPLNRRFAARAPEVDPGVFIIKAEEDLADPGHWGYHEIYGDFLLARCDAEGNTTSLNDEDIERFTRLFGLCCVACAEPHEVPGAVYCGAACASRAA